MATLTLDRTWVNLLASGEGVGAYTADGRQPTTAVDGEIRTYAGGRQRSITQEGVRGTYTFTLRLLTRAQVDTLVSWKGLPVQVRDTAGRRFFGVFYEANEVEYKGATLFDLPLVLQVATFDEGV